MCDAAFLEVSLEFAREVAGTVVTQEPRPMPDPDLIDSCGGQSMIQDLFHIAGVHGGEELPGDDVAGEGVEHGGQVAPAPADDLEVGEVGLPELMHPASGIFEAVIGLNQDVGRTGNQVVGLEDPVDAGFGNEVALDPGHHQPALRRMDRGVRLRAPDRRAPRPPHPPRQHPRDERR